MSNSSNWLDRNGGLYAMPVLTRALTFSRRHLELIPIWKIDDMWKDIIKKYKMGLNKELSPILKDWESLPVEDFSKIENDYKIGKYELPIFNYVEEMNDDKFDFLCINDNEGGGMIHSIPLMKVSETSHDLLHKYIILYDSNKKKEYGDFETNLRDYLNLILLQRVDYISLKYRKINEIQDLNYIDPESLNEFIRDIREERLSTIAFAKNIAKDENADNKDIMTSEKSIKATCNEILRICADPGSIRAKKRAFDAFDKALKGCEVIYNPCGLPISSVVVNDFIYREHDGRFELYLCKGDKVISRKKAVNNRNSYILAMSKMMKKVNDDPDGHYLLIIGFINYFTPKELEIMKSDD